MSDKGKDSYTREDEDDEDFDDIPDLESVESSEYCDSDEDPDMNPTAIKDLQSANFLIAKNWLNPDGGLDGVFKEFEVLMIYTYTPFLYGEHIEPSYWDNQWFGLFRKANLISQRPFNLDHLFIRDIRVLEILGLTLDWCWAHFGPMQDAVYLGTMLDFWDKIKDNRDFPAVVKYAKGLKWFSEILKHIQAQPDDLGLSNSEFKDAPHTLELCVLYAISHVCYQIVSKTGARHTFRTDLDSRTRIASGVHSSDIQHNLERAEIAFLVLERVEYLDHYRNALRLSPFDKTIYESRLQAHILSAHYLDAASDSMRLLCLQKNHREAHLCLVKSLQELSEETRANIARDKYFSQFPMPSDRQRLERFLNSRDCDITIVKPVHTDTSQSDYKSLRELSKVGTGYYSKGDYDDAHIAFGVCIKNARDKPVWRYSVSWREGLRFLLAVQYCYAQSLFNMGKCLAAIDIFLKLRRYHKMYPFPAAHYWSAMCYINQKRYAEAVQYINTGLKICDSHEARGYSILYWPGTSSTIRECLPQNVKSKLLQIQSQVLKEMEPMATCHYLQCLNYNLKTKIMQEGQEYKGHYVIKCSQKCSIAFHPTCWKKQKNSLCFNSDRAVLSQHCLTPNCNGKVTHIVQYDHTEKIKSEMTLDEMNGDSVKKRKGLDPISLSSSSDSSSSNKNDKTTAAGSENSKTEANSAKPVEQDLNEETRKTSVVEEARNGKDSEEREAKPKSKKKKKNKHQKEEEPQKVNGYELCKSTGDESLKDKEFTVWDSDPAEPFEIPEHFKEQIRQVEGKGITPSDRPESPPDIDMEVSRIQKNIVSCFEKLFREHGPLNPLDPLLAGAFRNLKGREVLEPIMHRHGGLAEYLLNFPNFRMFENDRGRIVIGLKDKGWNSESMDNDTSTGSAMASGGGPPGIMGTFDTGTVDTPAASVDAGTMDATTTASNMDSSTDILKSNSDPSDDILARHFSSGRDPLRKPVLDFPFGPIPHDINATFTNTGGATNTHVSTFTGAVPKTVTDNGVSTVRLLGASTILVTTSAVVGPTDGAAKRKEEEAFRRSSRYKSIESGLSKSDWNKASYGKGMMPEMRSRRIAEANGGEVKEKISTVPETGGGVVSEMEQKSSNSSSNNDEETGPDSSTKGGSASEAKQKAIKDSNDGPQTSNKPAPPPPPPPPPPPLPPLKRAPVVPGMMKQKARKASGSSASGKFIIGGAKALREEPALQNVGVPLGKTPVDENEMETCTRTDMLYRPQYKLREKEAKTGGDRDVQKHSIGNGANDKQKTKGAAKVVSVDKGTQCLYIKTSSATQTEREEKTVITVGVNTDPMPVVKTFKENYDELKETYEKLVKEKESLESKLNVSEDSRVKLQRQHSRELDKNIKKCQSEMRKEMESKLQHSEDLLKLEKEKLQKERRESSEQMKALRADIKQWQDKLNRHKKDVQKKDKEKQDASKILQEEKDELGKRLVSQEEYYQKLLETHVKRAIDSEVRLLNERKETLIKPTEQRLQELDRLCTYASQAMPGGEPELVAYREQLRQSLEMYKNSVDEQISKVIAKEQDLNQLEPVAPPLTHMSPQLKIKTQLVQRSLFASVQRGIVPGLQPPGATGPPQGTAPPPVSMAMPLSAPLDQNMKTGEGGGSGGGDNMMTFPSANPETVPQPPPGGFGMNNSGTGMSQGGMGPGVSMSSGMDQTGMGMGPGQMRMGPQTSMGMSQTGMGMNQSSMGMNQTGMGLSQSGMGLSQSGMVMNSAGIGVSQSMNQTGMNIEQGGMGMSYNQAGMGSSQGGMGMSVSGQAGLDAGMNFSQATNHDMGMGLGMGLSQVGMGMGLSQGGMGMGLGGMGMSQVGMSMDHSRMGMGAGMGPGGLGPVGTGMGKPNFGMGMRPNLQVSAANQITAMQPPGGGGASGQGGGAKPNSERRNFDQLVTKLSPLYPHYSREDFKRAVLELRKKVTLTGLPLDEVIQKVRQVINEREISKMSAGPAPMATLPQMALNEGFGFSQQSLMTQGSMFRPMMQQAPQMQSPPLPIHQFQQQKAQQQQAQAQQHQIQAQQQQLQAQQQQLQAQQQQMQQQSQQKQQQQSQSAEYNDDDNCIICYEDMLPGDSLTLDCRHRFHNHCIRSWLKEQKTCPTCRNYALLKDEFPFLH